MHHGKGVHRSCFVAHSNARAPGSALCLYPKPPASLARLLEAGLLAQCLVTGRRTYTYVFFGKGALCYVYPPGPVGARKRGRRRGVLRPLAPGGWEYWGNATGAISMTPSRPPLQRTSLCCAKMPVSVLDDGGEVMAIVQSVPIGA